MIIAILVILGLVFGSFVNALVWRLRQQDLLVDNPEISSSSQKRRSSRKISVSAVISTEGEAVVEKSPKKPKRSFGFAQDDNKEDYSIMHGRSMCPDCHHTLAAKDLVPVLSWILLGGKCRYCRKPISWQYPLVELLTAVLFALSYLLWPLELDAYGITRLAIWLVYVVFFVALSVYDLHWQELPDRLVWPIIGLAVCEAVFIATWQHSFQLLVWAGFAGVILFGLFWLIFQVSGGNWIGGGDVKLVLALGIIVGAPLPAFLVIFIASLIGTIASVPMLLSYKPTRGLQVPFGPALLLATFIVYFAGAAIISWYQSLLYQ